MVTMILGLMAGQLLMGPWTPQRKLATLFGAGLLCFLVSMAADTNIWPVSIGKLNYTICPTVKRIWTPTWAVFSAGWAFTILGAFYWLVDMRGFRKLVFPLVVVGMNSIAVYVMAHLIDGWLAQTLRTHLRTVEEVTGLHIVPRLYDAADPYAAIVREVLVLFLIWLICLWMYRRRIFIRI
jgi:predicted acyltransferase